MVFIPFDQTDGTVHAIRRPCRQTCRNSAVYTMRFKVRFVNHIKSKLVAQIIPSRIVRKVTGTYGIDIEILHDHNILKHRGIIYSSACYRVRFDTVHAFKKYGLAVYQHPTVFQFKLPESNFTTFELHTCPILVNQGKHHRIQIGLLSRPFQRVRHHNRRSDFSTIPTKRDRHFQWIRENRNV